MNPFQPPTSETPDTPSAAAADYRKKYWQQYKMRRPRIYGSVSQSQYAEIQQIAHANGRSIWAEVWHQSVAYRQQKFLPPSQIQNEVEKLYVELRHINDNLNRLSEQSAFVRTLLQRNQITNQVQQMEASIEAFLARPWKLN